jgi:hypothetical protein
LSRGAIRYRLSELREYLDALVKSILKRACAGRALTRAGAVGTKLERGFLAFLIFLVARPDLREKTGAKKMAYTRQLTRVKGRCSVAKDAMS